MRKLAALTLSITIPLICSGCYLAKQGAGLLDYQLRTVPIEKMLQDEDIFHETREFLERVVDIRNFAIDSLGLKRNKNYLSYVKIDRDYMVNVVVASKDDTFQLHKWWFPIIGSISYKGFFDKKDAEKAARKFDKKGGYDTYIGKAGAFSTLGFFADPVYSFLARYSVYDLASLIIHEQTHATVYLKNQTQLNEEIATFVGDVGGLLYVRNRFGEDSDEYKAAVLSKEDYATYVGLMRKMYEDLREVYGRDSSREYKLREKERVFDDFRSKAVNSYDSLFRTPRYRGLKQMELNNAVVAVNMTYNMDMSLFEELYEFRGGDMAGVVRDFKGLKRVKKGHKEYLRGIISGD